MADVHAYMKKKLDEYRKKNPELAYRFIDTNPDVMKVKIEVEGWKPIKEPGSGTAGEVRVGDLILAARPRKDVDEERKQERAKTKAFTDAPTKQYYSEVERQSGGYVVPMTPEELSRRKGDQWGRR